MEIKSVKKVIPQYPTIEEFAQNDNILETNIPSRWVNNAIVKGTLLVFLMAGTFEKGEFKAQKPETGVVRDTLKTKKDKQVPEVQRAGKVAPIFVHGSGSGAIGCMVVGSPVFISEDEARQIITDELEKANLHFRTTKCPTVYFDAKIPLRNQEEYYEDKPNIIDLTLDGYCKEANIVFEYISMQDEDRFKRASSGSSVQGYSTQEAANVFRDALIKNGRYNAAVFYDPVEYDTREDYQDENTDQAKAHVSMKKRAIEKLIAQVDDFIQWVRAEGLVK
jgi:hypothetical protein